MAVINIRNKWVRRSTLVVLFAPVFVIAVGFEFATAVRRVCQDVPYTVRSVWRGRA